MASGTVFPFSGAPVGVQVNKNLPEEQTEPKSGLIFHYVTNDPRFENNCGYLAEKKSENETFSFKLNTPSRNISYWDGTTWVPLDPASSSRSLFIYRDALGEKAFVAGQMDCLYDLDTLINAESKDPMPLYGRVQPAPSAPIERTDPSRTTNVSPQLEETKQPFKKHKLSGLTFKYVTDPKFEGGSGYLAITKRSKIKGDVNYFKLENKQISYWNVDKWEQLEYDKTTIKGCEEVFYYKSGDHLSGFAAGKMNVLYKIDPKHLIKVNNDAPSSQPPQPTSKVSKDDPIYDVPQVDDPQSGLTFKYQFINDNKHKKYIAHKQSSIFKEETYSFTYRKYKDTTKNYVSLLDNYNNETPLEYYKGDHPLTKEGVLYFIETEDGKEAKLGFICGQMDQLINLTDAIGDKDFHEKKFPEGTTSKISEKLPSKDQIILKNNYEKFNLKKTRSQHKTEKSLFSGIMFSRYIPNDTTGYYTAEYTTKEGDDFGIILTDLDQERYYVAPEMLNLKELRTIPETQENLMVEAARSGNTLTYYDKDKDKYRIIDLSNPEDIKVRDYAPENTVAVTPTSKGGFLTVNKLLFLLSIIFVIGAAGSVPSVVTAGLHKLPEYFYYIGGGLGGVALTSGAIAVMIGGIKLWCWRMEKSQHGYTKA